MGIVTLSTCLQTMGSSPIAMMIDHGRLGRFIKIFEDPFDEDEITKFEESKKMAEEPFYRKINLAQKKGYTSLQETDWGVTFESLEVIDQNKISISRLMKWNPDLKKGVVLYGPVGTGKSTICKAVINRWASPTYRCLFISVAEAMQRLKDTFDDKEKSLSHEEDKLVEPNLLILDDLGSEKSSEWEREKLFVLFEKRAKLDRRTFFTTNLNADEIKDKYKERIHDRMVEFCSWVKFEGQSFRKMNYESEI